MALLPSENGLVARWPPTRTPSLPSCPGAGDDHDVDTTLRLSLAS